MVATYDQASEKALGDAQCHLTELRRYEDPDGSWRLALPMSPTWEDIERVGQKVVLDCKPPYYKQLDACFKSADNSMER